MDDSASRRKDAWSSKQDETLIALRKERLPWKSIAERLGRSVESCCGRYRALLPQEERLYYRTNRRWTPADEVTLRGLMEEKKSLDEIADIMKVPRKSVYNKIEYLNRPTRTIHFERSSKVYVPPAREADRLRRMAAEMDITAEFFGDPRPGQSALDKKQGAHA